MPSGANTYTGRTQIASGTLQLGNVNALAMGAVAANSGESLIWPD